MGTGTGTGTGTGQLGSRSSRSSLVWSHHQQRHQLMAAYPVQPDTIETIMGPISQHSALSTQHSTLNTPVSTQHCQRCARQLSCSVRWFQSSASMSIPLNDRLAVESIDRNPVGCLAIVDHRGPSGPSQSLDRQQHRFHSELHISTPPAVLRHPHIKKKQSAR